MRERIVELSSKQTITQDTSLNSPFRFFDEYSRVTALSKVATRAHQAIGFFNEAKRELEERVALLSSVSPKTREIEEQIPIVHCLLALIYWLYPTEPGFDREKYAVLMFEHASLALETSRTEMSESFAIGLFIQLRVLQFLVMLKKYTITKMKRTRQSALAAVKKFSRELFATRIASVSLSWDEDFKKIRLSGLLGILYEGLGFSYFQLERDNNTALEYLHKSLEHLNETRNNALLKPTNHRAQVLDLVSVFYDCFAAVANLDVGLCNESLSEYAEGDDMLKFNKMARNSYWKAYAFSKHIPWHIYSGQSAYDVAGTYWRESSLETDKRKLRHLLSKAVTFGQLGLKSLSLWSPYDSNFVGGSWLATFYLRLAGVSEPKKKKNLIARSLELAQKASEIAKETGSSRYSLSQLGDLYYHNADSYYELASNSGEKSLANSDPKQAAVERIGYLKEALENCMRSQEYFREDRFRDRALNSNLLAARACYELMISDLDENEKREFGIRGIRQCREASKIALEMRWNENVARAHQQMAQILDRQGEYEASAFSYAEASDAYRLSRDSSKNGTRLYEDFRLYMLSWERIEKAKLAHSSSKFENASKYYEEASVCLLQTTNWKSQADLFLAESFLEKVEILSLKDETKQAIDLLEEGKSHLTRFIVESKRKEGSDSFAFRDLASELVVFCDARIFLESSKAFYRKGDVEHSNEALRKAASSFEELASRNLLPDSPRAAELGSMALLCDALEKFQRAPIDGDLRLYLTAKETFEKAAELTKSKSLRPLLVGLSNFSAFLFDSKETEKSLESTFSVDAVVRCDEELDNAVTMFKKIGNKPFLNMLRASKHILDATIKTAAAEREIQRPDLKAELYSKAKRSLSLASKYYGLLGSPKRDELLRMISEMKNQQQLIPLAHDIITEIASSQVIYAAVAESSAMKQSSYETSGGIEPSYVLIDHEFEKTFLTPTQTAKLILIVSNFSREPCTALRIDEAIPDDFEIVNSMYRISDGHSVILNERLEPGSSITLDLSCKATALGEFVWRPTLIYMDTAKNYKMSRSQTAQRTIVESSSPENFRLLIEEKLRLERSLEALDASADSKPVPLEAGQLSGEACSLRERIAEIDEKIHRVRYELEEMEGELRRVESDLLSLKAGPETIEREEEKINLEDERRMLIERLERRRELLNQIQLK
jgi:hypothetical protein